MTRRADILFMSASPVAADRLEFDSEARAIQRAVEDGCAAGAELAVETRWATEPLDLLRAIRAVQPAVLHFAGYGARDLRGGIYLRRADGEAALVGPRVLAETICVAGSSIRVVVFNACYAVDHAAGLLETVDCVAGVSGAIGEGRRARLRALVLRRARRGPLRRRGVEARELSAGGARRLEPRRRSAGAGAAGARRRRRRADLRRPPATGSRGGLT